ncbi:MAG TPA: glycosyltransferase [Roseiflexaceae bacterium]|nr:glycosyltransferase [Roseiflexaceae bacterium]
MTISYTCPARPIVLLASGTRGDLQPLLALGLALRHCGHAVRLVAHPRFATLVARYRLPFAALAGDPYDLFGRSDMQAALRSAAGLSSIAATLRYLQAARPRYAQMLASAWHACRDAAAVVVGLASHWGDQIAAALGIPCIWALLQPIGRSVHRAAPLQPFDTWQLPWARYLSHMLIEYGAWLPWADLLMRWRHSLGLRGMPPIGWPARMAARDDLVLYAFSERVAPRPPDWPAHAHVTGFWFLPPPPGWQPPAELQHWLASGAAPIYIGFGGMQIHADPARPLQLAEVLVRHGRRVVLADAPPGILPAGVGYAGDLPHQWLFPHLALVVHHGGVGTTAAALRAGIPTVTIPFGVDQHFWGRRIAALGAGPPPLAQSLPAQVQAILAATATPSYAMRAATLAAQLRDEAGVAVAAELIIRRIY